MKVTILLLSTTLLTLFIDLTNNNQFGIVIDTILYTSFLYDLAHLKPGQDNFLVEEIKAIFKR